MDKKYIAVIRIRGIIGLKQEVKDTFKMLHLYKKNTCTIIPNSKDYVGMLKKIKDYITWGEINSETFKLLLTHKVKKI